MGSVQDLLPSLLPDTIRLLYVEDDPEFADLTAQFLESADDRLSVRTVESATAGLEAFDEDIDCIVSDYDMPNMNGIELLKRVREADPRVPFILFTGKGSEAVASEAISSGVTDYLQKEAGTDQYAVLLNRVINAVEGYRAQHRLYQAFNSLYSAKQSVGIIDPDGRYLFVNPSYAATYGMQPEDLIGKSWHRLYPDEEIDRFEEQILPHLDEHRSWRGTATAVRADGTRIREELRMSHIGDGAHVCFINGTE
ncbi:response regulator [Natronomonas amylolytica]|uniref:response regulator n=1 Tax=Natronomonas amylolytica TaxID=3108498 RepID=UPI003008A938